MAKLPKTSNRKPGAPKPASGMLLTLDQVADELGCSRRQVQRLIGSGDLIKTQLSERMVRVNRRDLEHFCAMKRGV